MLAAFLTAGFAFWILFTESFISDDSYFYLVIARNMAVEGRQTFSSIIDTNGVHPLWLWILAGWSWIIHFVRPEWLDHAAYALVPSIACVLCAVHNSWRIARIIGWPPLCVVGIPCAYQPVAKVVFTPSGGVKNAVFRLSPRAAI